LESCFPWTCLTHLGLDSPLFPLTALSAHLSKDFPHSSLQFSAEACYTWALSLFLFMLSIDDSFTDKYTDNHTDNQIPGNFICKINKVPAPCFSHLLKSGKVRVGIYIFPSDISPLSLSLCKYHCPAPSPAPHVQSPGTAFSLISI